MQLDVVRPPGAEAHEREKESILAVAHFATCFDACGVTSQYGTQDDMSDDNITDTATDTEKGVGHVAIKAR